MKLNKKEHILFLSPGFPKDEKDTRCIPAMHLFLTHLDQKQVHDFSIIALDYPYEEKTYEWNGLKVHAIGGNNRSGLLKFRTYRKAIRRAQAINKTKAITRIHSFWLGDTALIGARLAKKWQVPHSCTLMGQDVLSSNRYFNKIKPLPELICLSTFHQKAFKSNFNQEAEHVIPWGVESMESGDDPKKTIDIIGVGNLTELKSFDRFIQIISALRKKYPDIRAELVGEGSEEQRLKTLAEEMGVKDNLHFAGVLNREATLSRMRKAKSLLHCSSYESFGLVIPEALALGLKVFSTPVGIAPELDEVSIYRTNDELIVEMEKWMTHEEKLLPKRALTIEQTVESYLKKVF